MAHVFGRRRARSSRTVFALVFSAWVISCGSSGQGATSLDASPGAVGDEAVDAPIDASTSDGQVAVDAAGPRADGPDELADVPPPIPPPALLPSAPLAYPSTTDVALDDATVGDEYSQTIEVRPGTGVPPYHVSASAIGLNYITPTEVENDTATAFVVVSGLATSVGTGYVVVDLVDGRGQRATSRFAVRVLERKAAIVPITLPAARAGASGYQAAIAAFGGTVPLTWSASGLPAGMAIDSSTGVLSGVPVAMAADTDVSFTVTITDARRNASTNEPAPRTASAMGQLHINPGYRVNVFALLTMYGCIYCHGDVGDMTYYKPRIAGIPTPPAGSENASGLIGEHPGGIAGNATPTKCDPSMTYVIPGDPDNSLLFQKVSGTLASPPPCGSCMPYQGSCNSEPTLKAADRELIRHWILSLPPMPIGKDLE
jgi:hypothetical protein